MNVDWLRRTRWPVTEARGYEILRPLEDPTRAAMILRVWDPLSDVAYTSVMPYAAIMAADTASGGLNMKLGMLLAQLDAVAWAMRKYDIPASWETAYYRVAGEWPEGMQT